MKVGGPAPSTAFWDKLIGFLLNYCSKTQDTAGYNMTPRLCISVTIFLLCSDILFSDLVGAPIEANPNSEAVKKAADFAVNQYNKNANDYFLYKETKMISAKTQVVSGTNYILDMVIERTNCKNEEGTEQNLNSCFVAMDQNEKKLICHFVVWEVVWKNEITLTKNNCTETQ
ncbi:hypothetical protein GDO86_009311 [Hymenochirus boettgeri]|uniref:Cystatin domain-containing protein n=1 Tax=Hymenochirus boettgeri TaxID=247094 RepID=A0A8T2JN80_9PIPI|nr:hypothetical protein GDO86_009311 [Hymenochirus boettgeri]